MPAEFSEQQIDIRAHHLFSLYTQLHLPISTKALKGIKLAILGYKDPAFPKHLMRVVDNIINGTTQRIRIVDGHDAICEECPQKREKHCRVAYRDYSDTFLSLVDQKIAENSALKIGTTYEAKDILAHIKTIRRGLIRTGLQMPSIIEIARLMEKAEK